MLLVIYSPAIQETLLASFYEEETVYADGYSPLAWSHVQIGDSLDTVIKQLGEPFERNVNNDHTLTLLYSGPGPRNISYRMRVIHFDPNFKVKMKIQEFYID